MLEITTTEDEFFDQTTNRFIPIPACTLTLEHSLISLAKWESKWGIPYLGEGNKTEVQELDYIRCMTIGNTPNINIYKALTVEDITTIRDYINHPMTATTFQKRKNDRPRKNEVITAEVLYSRIFAHGISMECQKWHLNRLLTLIRVCDLQNAPKDKMTKKQTAQWNAEQNAARRAKYNTRG